MSQQAKAQQERRQQRFELQKPVPVVNLQNDTSMGALVNITIEGLMIISNEALETNRLYQIQLQLPETVNGHDRVDLGVDCLWSRSDEQLGRHWAGFQIIDASQAAIKVIEAMIRNQ